MGEGYSIRSLYSSVYLTVEEGAVDGCALVATPFPVSWKVECVREEEQVTIRCVLSKHYRSYAYRYLRIRILWPTKKFAIELADLGSAVAGTKVRLHFPFYWIDADTPAQIHLAPSNPDDISQQWHLLEHEVSPTPVSPSHASPPPPPVEASSPPVETVVVSEDRDYVTTTRTTTTSTITTITTVMKTPRSGSA